MIRRYDGRRLVGLIWPCVPPKTVEGDRFSITITVSSDDLERLRGR